MSREPGCRQTRSFGPVCAQAPPASSRRRPHHCEWKRLSNTTRIFWACGVVFLNQAPHPMSELPFPLTLGDRQIPPEPHALALPALRRIRAPEGDQVSLGSPIQNPSPGSSGLLWHKRHFEPLLTQAPALAGYRSGGNLKGLCDPLVGPAIWSISIGLEQDSSVEQLAGVSPAAAHE